MTDCICR